LQGVRYRVEGSRELKGTVILGGSKNAALPCLCAALLTDEEVVLRNVPDIADVRTMFELLSYLNVKHAFEAGVVHINASTLENRPLPYELVKCMRASILILGPLLTRFGEVRMGYPGGCVIGKRPVGSHIDGLVQLGVEDRSSDEELYLVGKPRGGEVILPEFSVTATENVLLAGARCHKETVIELAAAEPHVQDLCSLLSSMGATIEGKGTHRLMIRGGALTGAEQTVRTDYLEAGFFVLAALVTDGLLRIERVRREDLLSFFKAVEAMAPRSLRWLDHSTLQVCRGGPLLPCSVKTNVFPGFPTDLAAPMGVAMTQAEGVSKLFERLYDRRFSYCYELERMGAQVEMLNAHQAIVVGPTPLKGRTVASHDIRAGSAMMLAALCARGETTITEVQYLDRGFDHLDGKLREVGARIERVEEVRV
jgi:UDP-N-acetylglucosamine 1-carboxyvinyltransferase